ncbi:Protein CBR-PHAT-5 [Caenorhabditis briggsae]|uniref:Protein CBR-PHAT-5 n=1 Tax=Caenorhabditis briggsae TaxID=6238 RepID=A8XB61_CAEBR|nr:Protein CBR-PHAT-5 [Caenorhabditis briggsae]CAP29841.2 Protein CBR-PHAT-5 [Caenorhabditis briggsae]
MFALVSILFASFLAPEISAVIGGDLNCTVYNGTFSHVSTVPLSPTPNATRQPGEPSSLPIAHPPADSADREDASTLSPTAETICPSVRTSECKTSSTTTVKSPATVAHPPPHLHTEELPEDRARLTSLTPPLNAPPGLATDSAPTTSTLTLNVGRDAPPLADSAKKYLMVNFDLISFKTSTYLLYCYYLLELTIPKCD